VPTYQYACTECGHQLEAVQSFSDEPLTVCPDCAGRLRKVFTGVGIVFKGSGFYRNDSRKADTSGDKPSTEKPAAAAKNDSKSESSSSPTPAKTESKPSSSSSSTATAAA
jgi:putative FmdB family regulatory protein